MGVESIELDTVNLRMVARTLPGKQFEVGRRLRVLVVAALTPRRHRHRRPTPRRWSGAIVASGHRRGRRGGDAGAGGQAMKLTLRHKGDRPRLAELSVLGADADLYVVADRRVPRDCWWLYETYRRRRRRRRSRRTQVVPPGFVPDPDYTWVPRTKVQDARPPPRTTTTPTETPDGDQPDRVPDGDGPDGAQRDDDGPDPHPDPARTRSGAADDRGKPVRHAIADGRAGSGAVARHRPQSPQ